MNILISYEHGGSALKPISIEEFCKDALRAEGVADNCEVSITFVTNDKIQNLNKQYRGLDKPTDVLSFECDGEVLEDGAKTLILGDIVIAPDVARAQCDEYGNSFIDEIELLLVHGILHLLGYDHIEDSEAEIMEAREKEILNAWKEGGATRVVHHSKKDAPLPILQVFSFAAHGVKYAWETQRNLKIHLIFACLAIALGVALNVGLTNLAIIVLCIGVVMSLELVNTSVESIVDLVSPEWHSLAKHAKDCAAGAVFISAIVSLILAALIYLPAIINLIAL